MTLRGSFTVSSQLPPEEVTDRLRRITKTSGLLRRHKGAKFSGSISLREFRIIPLAGGHFMPVYKGKVEARADGGTTVTIERRLFGGLALPIIIVLVLLILRPERGFLLIFMPAYLLLHYGGFLYLVDRTERKLCDVLEATADPSDRSGRARGFHSTLGFGRVSSIRTVAGGTGTDVHSSPRGRDGTAR